MPHDGDPVGFCGSCFFELLDHLLRSPIGKDVLHLGAEVHFRLPRAVVHVVREHAARGAAGEEDNPRVAPLCHRCKARRPRREPGLGPGRHSQKRRQTGRDKPPCQYLAWRLHFVPSARCDVSPWGSPTQPIFPIFLSRHLPSSPFARSRRRPVRGTGAYVPGPCCACFVESACTKTHMKGLTHIRRLAFHEQEKKSSSMEG